MKTPPCPRARAKPQQHARAQSSARGLPHLVVMGDDRGDLPAREHHVLPRQLVDHPGTRVQRVVEGVVPAVPPVPALQLAGFLHGQDLLVNRLPLATQAHRELGRKGAREGRDEPRCGGLSGTSRAQHPALCCPRSPSSAFWGAREPYLVGDDRPVVVFPGVQLPAAELAPPATRDGAATDPAQRAAWGTQGSAPQFPATSSSPSCLGCPTQPPPRPSCSPNSPCPHRVPSPTGWVLPPPPTAPRAQTRAHRRSAGEGRHTGGQ